MWPNNDIVDMWQQTFGWTDLVSFTIKNDNTQTGQWF